MSTQNESIEVIGAGSPIVDILTYVPDDFLRRVPGQKGGMELIDAATMADIVGQLPGEKHRAPGGAAANTILTLAKLGTRTTFLGMLGCDDDAEFYRRQFTEAGCDDSRFKTNPEVPTARCLSMITPDAERTMRTDLGAAATLSPSAVSSDDFHGCRHLHVEGYLLFNRELINAVLQKAKAVGCTISLDLGSFEVVQSAMDILPDLLRDYVDLVFANEEEAAAYLGEDDHQKALHTLAELCDIVAVKLGKEGALLKDPRQEYRVEAVPADTVTDTTGAGDLWAAGFLHGYMRGLSLPACGKIGAIVGSYAVQYTGAHLPAEACTAIREQIAAIE